MNKAILSPGEIETIIRRAAELDRMKAIPEAGLSQEEVKKLAMEAGISESAITQALSAVQKPSITAGSSTSDTHLFETREIASNAGTPWEDVVDELRHTFGTSFGNVKHDPKNREWIHTSSMGVETRVSLVQKSSRTRLRVSQRVGAGGIITEAIGYGAMIAAVFVFLARNSAWVGFLEGLQFGAAVFVLAAPLVFVLDRMWRKNKHKQLASLADRLAQILALPEEAGKETEKAAPLPIKRLTMDDVLFDEPSVDSSPLVNRLRSD